MTPGRLTSLELDQELQVRQVGAVDITSCATEVQVGGDCVVCLLDVGGSIARAGIHRGTLLDGNATGQSCKPDGRGEERENTSHGEFGYELLQLAESLCSRNQCSSYTVSDPSRMLGSFPLTCLSS